MFGKENELFDMTQGDINALSSNLGKMEERIKQVVDQFNRKKIMLEYLKSTKDSPGEDGYYQIVDQLMKEVQEFLNVSDAALKEVGGVVADVMTQNVNGNGEYDEFRR